LSRRYDPTLGTKYMNRIIIQNAIVADYDCTI
jgi:hypothetical protein